MELLHGDDLEAHVEENCSRPLDLYQVRLVAKQMLDALVYLQDQKPAIIHRDIKPANIVWDEKKKSFVLTDLNIATTCGDEKPNCTWGYVPPDLIDRESASIHWDKTADIFALGITLYRLACHTYPWPNDEQIPDPATPPDDPREWKNAISDEFAEFLLKAIRCDKERFASAREMRDALPDSFQRIVEVVPCETTPVDTNDYVDYLRTLYSQSHNNGGTRCGKKINLLDTRTYIPTKLDKKLAENIFNGQYKLVIITGNAGDGKTAFIRNIEKRAGNAEVLEHTNGAQFEICGIPFVSNYDGSQDEGAKDNRDVLCDFFSPFSETDHRSGSARTV